MLCGYQQEACLWNTAPSCSQKTLLRKFHLSDVDLFLVHGNFLPSAN